MCFNVEIIIINEINKIKKGGKNRQKGRIYCSYNKEINTMNV